MAPVTKNGDLIDFSRELPPPPRSALRQLSAYDASIQLPKKNLFWGHPIIEMKVMNDAGTIMYASKANDELAHLRTLPKWKGSASPGRGRRRNAHQLAVIGPPKDGLPFPCNLTNSLPFEEGCISLEELQRTVTTVVYQKNVIPVIPDSKVFTKIVEGETAVLEAIRDLKISALI